MPESDLDEPTTEIPVSNTPTTDHYTSNPILYV
jgi:hypothetical protein